MTSMQLWLEWEDPWDCFLDSLATSMAKDWWTLSPMLDIRRKPKLANYIIVYCKIK